MKGKTASPPMVGGASLLVCFAVLMLTMLALLSVTQARADRRLAEASVKATADYYAADLEAEEIFARLRNGEQVPGVEETDGVYRYHCSISEYQTLFVEIRAADWEVQRWQAVAHPEQPNETIPVWVG